MNDRFLRVPFVSLSATSSTIFYRTFDKKTFSFLSPVKKIDVDDEFASARKELIKPPKFSEHIGTLSQKAKSNLRRSVYNFLVSVNPNMLIDGTDKKKVSFLTLTLPSSQIKKIGKNNFVLYHTDKEIKSKCFNHFFTELRRDYQLDNFVWVAEKQVNGNLHFHILVDKFLPYSDIRKKWNRIINKLGYVDRYSAKMKKLSFDDYRKLRAKENKTFAELRSDYRKGCKCGWTNPNSVDINTLKKVKNVASYVSKYMTKGGKYTEKEQLFIDNLIKQYSFSDKLVKHFYQIKGRIWQCSQKISKSRKCVTFLNSDFIQELNNIYKNEKNKLTYLQKEFFELYIYDFKLFKEKLLSGFNYYINHIRRVFDNTDVGHSSTSLFSDLVSTEKDLEVLQETIPLAVQQCLF